MKKITKKTRERKYKAHDIELLEYINCVKVALMQSIVDISIIEERIVRDHDIDLKDKKK